MVQRGSQAMIVMVGVAIVLSGCVTQTRRTPPAVDPPPVTPAAADVRTISDPLQPADGEVGRIAQDGLPPIIDHIATKRRVVFLTIDDGWEQDPGFIREVRARRTPIMAFLSHNAAGSGTGYPYFRQLRDAGVPIENHTLTHPNLTRLDQAGQRAQICGMSGVIKREIGTRPHLFRPPGGAWNTLTRRAAKRCGLAAILLWRASVQLKGKIAYQRPGGLRPGDIILMHFRPGLAQDFPRVLRRIKAQGFELGDLQAYLAAAGVRRPIRSP